MKFTIWTGTNRMLVPMVWNEISVAVESHLANRTTKWLLFLETKNSICFEQMILLLVQHKISVTTYRMSSLVNDQRRFTRKCLFAMSTLKACILRRNEWLALAELSPICGQLLQPNLTRWMMSTWSSLRCHIVNSFWQIGQASRFVLPALIGVGITLLVDFVWNRFKLLSIIIER